MLMPMQPDALANNNSSTVGALKKPKNSPPPCHAIDILTTDIHNMHRHNMTCKMLPASASRNFLMPHQPQWHRLSAPVHTCTLVWNEKASSNTIFKNTCTSIIRECLLAAVNQGGNAQTISFLRSPSPLHTYARFPGGEKKLCLTLQFSLAPNYLRRKN